MSSGPSAPSWHDARLMSTGNLAIAWDSSVLKIRPVPSLLSAWNGEDQHLKKTHGQIASERLIPLNAVRMCRHSLGIVAHRALEY